jgi:two-component system sensor histidine kinase/response regulator
MYAGEAARHSMPLVLAADDYEPNLVVLAALLEPLHVEVVKASSGMRAVALARQHRFSVILLDVRMPGMSGCEAAELIHAASINRHTKVVFLTGDDVLAETLADEGFDVLPKPYSAAALLDKVSALLKAEQNSSSARRAG